MKKIIEGKLYNTDTAKLIGTFPNGLNRSDFGFFEESLYRNRAGKYFIYGYGGANSKYGVWHGNTGGSGEKIRAYTAEDAQEWAEEHLDADVYSTEFGEPEEASEDKVIMSISVLSDTKTKLETLKRETGKSLSSLIDEAVNKL